MRRSYVTRLDVRRRDDRADAKLAREQAELIEKLRAAVGQYEHEIGYLTGRVLELRLQRDRARRGEE